jgi:hypothetical protein
MRRFVLRFLASLLVIVVGVGPAAAVVPSSLTAQGKLTDSGGLPLPAGAKTFTFRIFDAVGGGIKVWPVGAGEVQSVTTSTEGLWTALVGAIDPLNEGVFADTVRWLEIEVDGTVLPRVRLLAGPFAFRVSTVDGATGGTITSKVSIGPGHNNTGMNAFVAGASNTASGDRSTVSGGGNNQATGINAVVGGGGGSSPIEGNLASGGNSVVGGGLGNQATEYGSSILGGQFGRARGRYSVVSGGGGDLEADSNAVSGDYSVIAGGVRNLVPGDTATCGGGAFNVASGRGAAVAGGVKNRARGDYSFIGGGGGGNASSDSNLASGDWSTVSGGRQSHATSNYASVSGGFNNKASGGWSVVGGGSSNEAIGPSSTVAGGSGNNATASSSTVGGGSANEAGDTSSTVAGGSTNTADGPYATVGGGYSNFASGRAATIAGGYNNTAAGYYSFAAGRSASAAHAGSFVWADNSSVSIYSSSEVNQVSLRATGGVRLSSDAGPARDVEIGVRYRDNSIVAWGNAAASGSLSEDFGVAYLTHTAGSGVYTIYIEGIAVSADALIMVASPEVDAIPASAASARLAYVNQVDADTFEVYITNGSFVATDNEFTVIVTAR